MTEKLSYQEHTQLEHDTRLSQQQEGGLEKLRETFPEINWCSGEHGVVKGPLLDSEITLGVMDGGFWQAKFSSVHEHGLFVYGKTTLDPANAVLALLENVQWICKLAPTLETSLGEGTQKSTPVTMDDLLSAVLD